jgi:O-antigen/teichoic acid export membrane protein
MLFSQTLIERHLNITSLTQSRIWQNIILASATLVNISIYIIIAHTLSTQLFGSYLFAQWLVTVTIPVIGTGMSTLASRQIAVTQSQETPQLIAGIFYFLWYRQLRSIVPYCLVYLCLSVALTLLFHDDTPEILLFSSLATLPILLSSIAGTTLRSLRRSDLLTMLRIFGNLLTLFFIIIAIQIKCASVAVFIFAFALSNTLTLMLAIVCIACLLPLKRAVAPCIFLTERLIRHIHYSRISATLDAIVWQRSELLLLACRHNTRELGFYALSSIISARVIDVAPALFSQWIFPFVMHYCSGSRFLNQYDAFVITSCYIIFLAVPIAMAMIVLCPNLLIFALGNSYLPVVKPLRILLIAAVFGSIATVSLTHIANDQHYNKQHVQRIQRHLATGVACLKILLAIPLVILWGITGAALASALAQIASALISILLCKRLLMQPQILP